MAMHNEVALIKGTEDAEMEKSLKYAIEKAKRNIYNQRYSKLENVLDAMYQYCIRADEVEIMVNSINKWLSKNDFYTKKNTRN